MRANENVYKQSNGVLWYRLVWQYIWSKKDPSICPNIPIYTQQLICTYLVLHSCLQVTTHFPLLARGFSIWRSHSIYSISVLMTILHVCFILLCTSKRTINCTNNYSKSRGGAIYKNYTTAVYFSNPSLEKTCFIQLSMWIHTCCLLEF